MYHFFSVCLISVPLSLIFVVVSCAVFAETILAEVYCQWEICWIFVPDPEEQLLDSPPPPREKIMVIQFEICWAFLFCFVCLSLFVFVLLLFFLFALTTKSIRNWCFIITIYIQDTVTIFILVCCRRDIIQLSFRLLIWLQHTHTHTFVSFIVRCLMVLLLSWLSCL